MYPHTSLSKRTSNRICFVRNETETVEDVFERSGFGKGTRSRSGALRSGAQIFKSTDMSLQVCHCGWSKYTSYHGLRVHQGKMGCTPKGMTIPKSEQYRYVPKVTYFEPQIKIEDPFLDLFKTSATSVFETPQRTHQTFTISSDKARRSLDFFIGTQEVDQVLELPPATAQQIAVLSKRNEKDKDMEKEKKAKQLLKARQEKMKADLQQKIHIIEHKMAKVRSSVEDCKGSLDAEWLEVNNFFSEVMRVVEDARQEALRPLEERRWKVKRETQDLIQKLQREIDVLRKSIVDLDRNPDLQVSPLTGLNESTDWKNVCVDTSLSFGTLQTTTSTMMKQIYQELEKLSLIELKRICAFAVDVKLDSTTAHQSLVISGDGKKVRDGGKAKTGPDSPERFDMYGSILGLNRLTSGKSYWEVEVSNKSGWDLGVARCDANRKGKLSLNPDNGYWVTVHYDGKKFAALASPPVSLSLKKKPQKVGVFVDYEEGLVSFYDVTSQSHIYSFTECLFGDEILPYFSPHPKQNEKNTDPLVISAVQKQL